MITVDEWVESQEFQIRLDAQGKIIDYLDSNVRRENKPEERIRQKTTRILVEEFKYSKEQVALERTIQIGRDETKRADIVTFLSEFIALSEISRILATANRKFWLHISWTPFTQPRHYIRIGYYK